ncbi:MAG: HD domain-containing protein [Clostridiales bacterium]|nr:HD domain-containing protein [Clostridiales bacterium]
MTMIKKTEEFLKHTFAGSDYLKANITECAYRLEHSYRVANIGKIIAKQEGFDVTEMVIACLLHDIAYCHELSTDEQRKNHGRLSAQIARPFLMELGLPADRVNDICYGIAIHVDDLADFEGQRTAFAETISDADNIDRFDVYRIYENLQYINFDKMSLQEKQEKVVSTLENLKKLRNLKLATDTAETIWVQRIDYYISFYERLKEQLAHSAEISNS